MVKLPQIQRGKIYILLAVLSWMGLLLVNLIRVFGEINQMEGVISKEITWVLEILFFIWLYIYFNDSIKKNENRSFIDFIWRPASTGLIATGTSFLINFFITC